MDLLPSQIASSPNKSQLKDSISDSTHWLLWSKAAQVPVFQLRFEIGSGNIALACLELDIEEHIGLELKENLPGCIS